MNCESVRRILTEYEEDQLPEILSRQVEQHLDQCPVCGMETAIADDPLVQAKGSVPEDFSIVNQVMERIHREQKWALPVTKRSLRISQRIRKLSLVAAAFFILLFSGLMFIAPDEPVEVAEADGEWITLTADHTISAVQPIEMEEVYENSDTAYLSDESQGDKNILASIDEALLFSADPVLDQSHGLNLTLTLSLFGLLVTMIVMNWLVRV